MDWDKLSRVFNAQNWIILMILGSMSFLFMSSAFTLGIIIGGLLIIANFNLLQHTIRCTFSAEGVMITGKSAIIAKYYLRLAGLGLIIYLVIAFEWVNPIGLAVGLSIVVISIITIGICAALKTSSREAI